MEKFIEIEKVIASKNPRLAKRLPGFVMNYIKRILHQDEANQIMHKLRDKKDYAFCVELIKYFDIKVNIEGKENIPQEKGFIFAGNHPLGGMDAIAFISEMEGIRDDIKFIVNDLLLYITNMHGLFAGVNKVGSKSKASLLSVNDLFASDQAIFIFPAGLVSRKIKGKIMDLDWKKTIITRAIKFNKPIVPVYNDGRLRNFFYNLANFRKTLGIKANLEMFYLADELFRQRGKTINIRIGEAIRPEIFDDTKSHKEWASWLRDQTYALKTK